MKPAMRILVDVNIPRRASQGLSELDHDVLDIRGTKEEGLPDELLWKKALDEERVRSSNKMNTLPIVIASKAKQSQFSSLRLPRREVCPERSRRAPRNDGSVCFPSC
ncbi:MAG: DUF5615 family PIN-like protein [Planctomycetota bacterium]|jgi:hypothetical protein